MPIMTAEEAAEWGKSLSFEKVWAAFAETDRMFKEAAERSKEADRRSKEADERLAKLERTVERVSANVGGLGRSVGELVETLIAARLWEKFPQYGLSRAYQRLPVYDEKNVIKTDIDVLLVNAVIGMAVEVKRELDHVSYVDEHVKRLRLIKQYPPEFVRGKELLGAMAGGVVDADVKNYAYTCGFFVLELAGEAVHLVPPPEGFVPKRW